MKVFACAKRSSQFILWAALGLWGAPQAFSLTAGDICYDRLQTDPKLTSDREEICQRVNNQRLTRAQTRLMLDSTLSQVAQRYAQEMAKRGFFDHVTPDGVTFRVRLQKGQVDYRRAGENIARGQKTAAIVVDQWMQSPGHRKNILTHSFRKIGVGSYNRYWVQVFTD